MADKLKKYLHLIQTGTLDGLLNNPLAKKNPTKSFKTPGNATDTLFMKSEPKITSDKTQKEDK